MQAMQGSMAAMDDGSGTVPGNGLLTNLVAYWGLDEAAGANNALDKHSNGLTLTHANSPGSTAGLVYAGARTLSGANQYFNRASETLLQVGDIDATWAAWVYVTNVGALRPIIAKDDTSTREYSVLIETDRRIRLLIFSGAGSAGRVDFNSVGTVTLNAWSFVVAWHDSVNNLIGISVDNGTPTTAARTTGIYAGAAPFRIGSLASNMYIGTIGPVAMWKRVLSSTDITALYAAGAGLAYSAFTA